MLLFQEASIFSICLYSFLLNSIEASGRKFINSLVIDSPHVYKYVHVYIIIYIFFSSQSVLPESKDVLPDQQNAAKASTTVDYMSGLDVLSRAARFQIPKTRQIILYEKICETDWSHLCIQQFDKF